MIDLKNQTANLMATWIPADGSAPKSQFLYATGINGSVGWSRMPYLIQVPQGIARAALAIVVYANSERPAGSSGQLWARNMWALDRKSGNWSNWSALRTPTMPTFSKSKPLVTI